MRLDERLEPRRDLLGARRRSPRLLHPGVGRREQNAQPDPVALVVPELPERDGLLVATERRCDLGRHVTGLKTLRSVVDGDRVRVVLVLRLADEREASPRRETVVLQGVGAVRRAGELDDPHAWVVPLHRVSGRRVAQPVARLAALEPDPESPTAADGGGVLRPGTGGSPAGASSLRTRGVACRHQPPARRTAYSDPRSSSTDTERRSR